MMSVRTDKWLVAWAAVGTLSGCGAEALCASTAGTWGDCAVQNKLCEGGQVREPGVSPAVCSDGCTCPSEAPVWHDERGCITEVSCVGADPA